MRATSAVKTVHRVSALCQSALSFTIRWQRRNTSQRERLLQSGAAIQGAGVKLSAGTPLLRRSRHTILCATSAAAGAGMHKW